MSEVVVTLSEFADFVGKLAALQLQLRRVVVEASYHDLEGRRLEYSGGDNRMPLRLDQTSTLPSWKYEGVVDVADVVSDPDRFARSLAREKLDLARWQADRLGMSDRVTFVHGTTEDVAAPEGGFDAARSMLVMQRHTDDGSKSAYLRSIRERLRTDAVLVDADVSFESEEEFQAMVPVFRRHAQLAGVPDEVAAIDVERIPTMPIIGPQRTVELLSEAGFGSVREAFRGLWYRAWVCVA